MTVVLASTSPSAWWYLTRGSGIVSLVLLTAALVLGIVDLSRWHNEHWPRFVVDSLHRNVSLLALVTIIVHIVTAVADSFAPITFLDAVFPFITPYRPLWIGMGTLAFDILLAVAITSAMRRRLGHRTWRAVHWAAYACWPLALLHGLGSGTDTQAPWMLVLSFTCLALVLAAAGWRTFLGWPTHPGRRKLAASLLSVGPFALLFWFVGGPLSPGWASKAGTPPALLASTHNSNTVGPRNGALHAPFAAHLDGSFSQSAASEGGLVKVGLAMKLNSGASGQLDVTIIGQPLSSGGVSMSQNAVTLGPLGEPSLYKGEVISLHGSRILAKVKNGAGTAINLDINVSVNQAQGTVSGVVHARSGEGFAQ
jgi:methionine sulfoxide reductase heme-binding subunit